MSDETRCDSRNRFTAPPGSNVVSQEFQCWYFAGHDGPHKGSATIIDHKVQIEWLQPWNSREVSE